MTASTGGNRSQVTRDGQVGVRPGSEAMTGVNVPPGPPGGPRRKRKRDEPEFGSYYDLPILNKIVWSTTDVASYLFLGGLGGAGSVLAGAAHATGRPRLARVMKVGAGTSLQVGLVLLVHDLGRPARFLNMLRMVKVTSPMSIGSWLLLFGGTSISAAEGLELVGKLPRTNAAATAVGTAFGPAIATYTAALLAQNAVPAWHDGHREMPYVFAGSALASAAGLGLLAGPADESAVLAPLATAGGLVEVAMTRVMMQRMGVVKEAYEHPSASRYLKIGEALTLAGSVLAGLSGRRRGRSALAGAALLAGSYLTRVGIFKAGFVSTQDPKYVVVPQRERLERREREATA